MKTALLLPFLFLLQIPSLAHAASAQFTATFDHPNGVDASLEYVVEVKQPDGSFVEVAKGAGSPIIYTANASWGTYTVRIFTRSLPATAFVRNVAADTSVEASTKLVPGKPTNPKINSNRSGG